MIITPATVHLWTTTNCEDTRREGMSRSQIVSFCDWELVINVPFTQLLNGQPNSVMSQYQLKVSWLFGPDWLLIFSTSVQYYLSYVDVFNSSWHYKSGQIKKKKPTPKRLFVWLLSKLNQFPCILTDFPISYVSCKHLESCWEQNTGFKKKAENTFLISRTFCSSS